MSATAGHEVAMAATTPTASTRNTKRKLDEALHSLDEALQPTKRTEANAEPSPAKRARFSRSIYSTLAKYGIKSKEPTTTPKLTSQDGLLKSAPHLASILSRTATRTRKAMSFKMPDFGFSTSESIAMPSSSMAEYRPSSKESFLTRLSSFKLSTYANKPSAIDAVAAAKCGWTNDGKDRLICAMCNASWVVAGREGLSRESASALLEKQKVSLVETHKDGCPWKLRQCDPDIYRIPLKAPPALALEIKSRAMELDSLVDGIEIRHPLTTTQVQAIRSISGSIFLPSHSEPSYAPGQESETAPIEPEVSHNQPSETALLTSLFGWAPVSASQPVTASRPGTPTLSRTNSAAPSIPPSPARSASTQGLSLGEKAQDKSVPHSQRPSTPRLSSVSAALQRSDKDRDSRILQCSLCQRRIGLWAFKNPATATVSANSRNGDTPSASAHSVPVMRQLDLLKEHRSYCPYVVRSTTVPSLPTPPTTIATRPALSRNASSASLLGNTSSSSVQVTANANDMLEGWRAVLLVVSRNGLGRRQKQRSERSLRLRRSVTAHGIGEQSARGPDDQDMDWEPVEGSGIEAMMDGVKTSGGKDLLKYVRTLLA